MPIKSTDGTEGSDAELCWRGWETSGVVGGREVVFFGTRNFRKEWKGSGGLRWVSECGSGVWLEGEFGLNGVGC